MMASPSVLEVEHLAVQFGKRRIFTDLSFHVEAHQALAIIGPNGAGKTVLFQALVGAIPHEGALRWAPGVRLGYVPQKMDLERDLPITGADFLRAKVKVTRSDHGEISHVLAMVGLTEDALRNRMGALSGGQLQRLLLAFALLGRPTVLLLDEPTAGVDEPGEELLYERLHKLHQEQGLTLVLISHELSVVYRYADTVLCLGHAQPCMGPPHELLTPERIAEIYGAPVKFHHHPQPRPAPPHDT